LLLKDKIGLLDSDDQQEELFKQDEFFSIKKEPMFDGVFCPPHQTYVCVRPLGLN